MGFLKYMGLLLNRAAQKSVLLTDRLTILIVPFATLVIWMAGAKMTDSVQETLALGVAITVLAVVLLRLIAASYFLWKDDQAEKARLTTKLEDPDRQSEAALKFYTIEVRKGLSRDLARLAALAARDSKAVIADQELLKEAQDLSLAVDTAINQLSYDWPLRIAAIRLKDYCLDLIFGKTTDRDRFWAQRKITFRLLHKEDHIADFMSLMELEILEEEAGNSGAGDGGNADLDIVSQLKTLIRKLGDSYYSTDIRDKLRKSLEGSDPII